MSGQRKISLYQSYFNGVPYLDTFSGIIKPWRIMYTYPLFAVNIFPKHPSLYLHHTILVACMPMPSLQNTKTLFSRNWQSCGQARQQTSKIHLVTDTSQLYHNCSGLNPCSRSLTLIQHMADTLPWVFAATLTDSSIIYRLEESPRPLPQFRSLFWAPDLSLQSLSCCLYT